jgi:hypothetical protein
MAVVLIVAACVQFYGISQWPMADDEVPSLVEMGLLDVEAQTFSVPASQVGRLPRAVPVWYKSQRLAIDLLPKSEMSFRLPSVIWGILTLLVAFVVGARWRGLWFATALAVNLLASQPFVFLSQLDRFYSLPLLFLTLTLVAMWSRWSRVIAIPVIVALTVLSVLSHNVTVAMFALAFASACAAFVVGSVSLELPVRSGVAAATSVLVYLLYLKPIVSGWSSTGNPTPVLVSFAAHAGIPALALALFGTWLAIGRRKGDEGMVWWGLMFVGSVCMFQLPFITWNPRYFLFFLPAVWVLAAYAMEYIALRVGRWSGVAWYCCVALLFAPGLASHLLDGSRHDYRAAARVLVASDAREMPILSDDAETISYYLPANLRRQLMVRTKVTRFPESEFFLVARSNAWMPLPQIPHRRMDLLAEIYRRRFDQFSHILRVYRIAPGEHQ